MGIDIVVGNYVGDIPGSVIGWPTTNSGRQVAMKKGAVAFVNVIITNVLLQMHTNLPAL